MSNRPVIIYGAGHLGRQVLHHVTNYCDVVVLGYIDDTQETGTPVRNRLECLGSLEEAAASTATGPERAALIFAIGYSDMRARYAALLRARSIGYQLYSVIHPRAIIEPDARVGAGSIVLGGAIVDQNVETGAGCFVDVGVRIGEDSALGDNNYLSSGAAIGGAVSVGHSCFFGMDCTATTGVSIGSNCFLNAGALIARNIQDGTKLVELRKSKELPN